MSLPFFLCDVFADRPYAGNPLAVFLDDASTSDDEMAALAGEFGWSEITFVSGAGGEPRVRIWTPWAGEIPFAGHPTVGTAVVLASVGRIGTGWNTLHLGIGPVAVQVSEAGDRGGAATMTQGTPTFGDMIVDRAQLAATFGLEPADLVTEVPAQLVSTGLPHFLVPVRSLDALARAQPDFSRFPAIASQLGVRWAYLFSVDTPQSTVGARARLLAPGREDPATGSAAGPLGAYLVHYGLHRGGGMEIEQGIEMGRPSLIRVDVPVENGEIGPVRVSGRVRIWANGERLP